MLFKQIQPMSALTPYVQYFWTLESVTQNALPQVLGPLADGCPGLIFQPDSEGAFYDQHQQKLHEIFLYGQTLTRTSINLIGKFKTMGVSFKPHALKPLFGFNANELTDDCLDINLVSSAKDFKLNEKLLEAGSSQKHIEVLSTFLLKQLNRYEIEPDTITQYASSKIMVTNGQVSLKSLQQELKLSERTFERKFNQLIGISPKVFSKICRFQASLHQLKSKRYETLSDVAFDNGFSDQSHFIRVFREFAGFSPFQFQKQSAPLSEDFPIFLR
jgi:AraC-like DNA-binding protein